MEMFTKGKFDLMKKGKVRDGISIITEIYIMVIGKIIKKMVMEFFFIQKTKPFIGAILKKIKNMDMEKLYMPIITFQKGIGRTDFNMEKPSP